MQNFSIMFVKFSRDVWHCNLYLRQKNAGWGKRLQVSSRAMHFCTSNSTRNSTMQVDLCEAGYSTGDVVVDTKHRCAACIADCIFFFDFVK